MSRRIKVWQVVEVLGGERVRRATGSLALCRHVAAELTRLGFEAVVEPYDDEEAT